MKLDIITASSINGIIAPLPNKSSLKLLTRFKSIKTIMNFQNEIRNKYAGIMVGTNTVKIDNPCLNSNKNNKQYRITIDTKGKIPKNYKFFDNTKKTIIGVCKNTPKRYLEFLKSKKINYLRCGQTKISLPVFIKKLEKTGIKSIIVEGGGTLNYSLIKNRLVNKIYVVEFPLILNSKSINLFNSPKLNDLIKIKTNLVDFYKIKEFLIKEYRPLNQ